MSENMLDIKECMYKFLQEPTRESFIDIVFSGVGEQNSMINGKSVRRNIVIRKAVGSVIRYYRSSWFLKFFSFLCNEQQIFSCI